MRVVGHGLQDEGAAYSSMHCTEGPCKKLPTVKRLTPSGTSGHGHGLCECGALSPHLETGNARERWHREHKAEQPKKPA
jgi:hypothetical protein